MKLNFLYLITAFILTACYEKDSTLKEKQSKNLCLKNTIETKSKKITTKPYNGWPPGLPKDTVTNIPLKKYSSSIKSVILESVLKNHNQKKMKIILLEVYRNRAWDGEKWFTTKNEYSVLICDKNSVDNSKWIVPVAYVKGKYITEEWINR
jgi:hypothetical protein